MSAIADIKVKPATESQFLELLPVPEEKRVTAVVSGKVSSSM